MNDVIQLNNGAEIDAPETLFPLIVRRGRESVRVDCAGHLKPGDLLEVTGVTGMPAPEGGALLWPDEEET